MVPKTQDWCELNWLAANPASWYRPLDWGGLLWCFYQTLILTAPIHCRASVAETLMHWSKSKKQTRDGLSVKTCLMLHHFPVQTWWKQCNICCLFLEASDFNINRFWIWFAFGCRLSSKGSTFAARGSREIFVFLSTKTLWLVTCWVCWRDYPECNGWRRMLGGSPKVPAHFCQVHYWICECIV